MLTVELIPDPEYGGFTARLPDIPAYGEGETEEQAIDDLLQALRGYVDTFGLEDALARLNPTVTLRRVDVDLAQLASG
jgi:hypothetical protein